MSEAEIIANTIHHPVTITSLKRDLLQLGVQPGSILMVHTSMSKLGWVCGGAQAVILALEETLGAAGTLVMPAHSGDLSDPAEWVNPPVPESWWETIRQTMPAFDPSLTPTRGMGMVAESFRKQSGTLRSSHPQVSFAARGLQAPYITENHSLQDGLGDKSPLGRLYDLDAWILLLGVTHENNTSLHLAEARANYPGKPRITRGAPIFVQGERKWVTFEDTEDNTDDFEQIGADFEKQTGLVFRGKIGMGTALLFKQRLIVDFAVKWMCENRKNTQPGYKQENCIPLQSQANENTKEIAAH